MTITFYNVTDPPKKLIKNITNVVGNARALAPTGQVNTLNPVVIVAWDSTNGSKIINANYAYIDTFKRYYYITTGIDTAGRIVVSGKVDYLMSYAKSIKKCPATIIRAEQASINYVPDSKLPIDTNRIRITGVRSSRSVHDDLLTTPYIVVVNAGVNNGGA